MRIELLKNDWLNFVELNVSGDNENVFRCHPESSYLDGYVFSLFATCFERSNKLYEYFGPTRYNTRYIIPLQNQFKSLQSSIDTISNAGEFKKFAGGVFLGKNFLSELEKNDPQWEKNWKTYQAQLLEVCGQLIELINRCIDQERILWVIGY